MMIILIRLDHIVPPENVLAMALPSGPKSIEFEFTAANRTNTAMVETIFSLLSDLTVIDNEFQMDELGRVLVSLCSNVPDGLVVFFCSYDHLQKTYAHLEKTFVLNKILPKKKVFIEPKRTSDVENILGNYTKTIKVRRWISLCHQKTKKIDIEID